jgi:protoporphyrin/coproporphyrin ferrochelatase
MKDNATGFLFLNIGTPESCTLFSIIKYLHAMLSDRHIVTLSRWLWWPILYGWILPIRPWLIRSSYRAIWTVNGSPLLANMLTLVPMLASACQINAACLEVGMLYSRPSVKDALIKLRQQRVKKVIIVPLYPLYCSATHIPAIQKVVHVMSRCPVWPTFQWLQPYGNDTAYLKLLAKHIENNHRYRTMPSYHLIMSFHSVPKKLIQRGEPYEADCYTLAHTMAGLLQLSPKQWTVCFQSALSRRWLAPSTQDCLQTCANNKAAVEIIAPGFSFDCLETLEEINLRYRQFFYTCGGKFFHYIPCLNDTDEHIQWLKHYMSGS